ncbi:2-phosphosulfolactate phosphatase [Oryzobacter terrae]|uniref:2-phosphosulfolactate phosphatase n=1 Tax=Oryzobacter terrae TaxID=1620385 RepID=UPI0036719F50
MTHGGQQGFDVRVDWALPGARALVEGGATTVAVVDVLSFTTTLSAAVERGSAVRPHRFYQESARAEAAALGAVCAVGRSVAGPGEVSLSPASVLAAEPVPRLVLPSPNGSAICEVLADLGVEVVGGALRNATAVDSRLAGRPGPVGVVAAGERWVGDGSLRPAVEDLWGAGAVVDALVGARPRASLSPEAAVARAAWLAVRDDVTSALRACASGVELRDKGFGADVDIAAAVDVSDVVPVLVDGWFRPAT